ncbi:MAG: hypothetical protein ACK456_10385 [Pseudanabaenaceae cyanobacterium]|jgi:hypothetical protein
MKASIIRGLVNSALVDKTLTVELEQEINQQLNRQGFISDFDYAALEYLMRAVNEGKIRQASY